MAGDAAMNEILRDRLQRKLEALPEDKPYQVLDYVEFLESKYAERPAGAAPFQRVAETLEDTLRAGRVPRELFTGTRPARSVPSSVSATPRNVAAPAGRPAYCASRNDTERGTWEGV